jgi:hypothetical protein
MAFLGGISWRHFMATKKIDIIDLGLTRQKNSDIRRAELHLVADKAYRGGVESDATVFWIARGSRQHAFGLGGGDFSKKVVSTPMRGRLRRRSIPNTPTPSLLKW